MCAKEGLLHTSFFCYFWDVGIGKDVFILIFV